MGTRSDAAIFLGTTAAVTCLLVALPGQASVFSADPNASGWTIRIGAASPIEVHVLAGGTASLTSGPSFLSVSARVWTTSHPDPWFSQPSTALFTGVPLLEWIRWGAFCTPAKVTGGLCTPLEIGEVTGPLANGPIEVGTGSVPNPVGPGTLTGAVGYGGLQGSVSVGAFASLHWPKNLGLVGASNAVVDTLDALGSLGGFRIEATLGPWVTDTVVITGITTNLVSALDRDPPEIGIPFTLELGSYERVRTFLNSTWQTTNGFHPPFTFASQWREWTFAQTVSGKAGTHGGVIDPIPKSRLVLMHTVTLASGGITPSVLTANTGSVSLVTPMRIDTGDEIANVIPGVMRMKFSFVPEPGNLLLLAAGFAGLCTLGARRRFRPSR